MNEKPLSLIPPLVRATLLDNKLETRRVMRPQPYNVNTVDSVPYVWHSWSDRHTATGIVTESDLVPLSNFSPYGQAGDFLWVREAWRVLRTYPPDMVEVQYTADGARDVVTLSPDRFQSLRVIHTSGNKPARFMPREVARLILQVDKVWPEQLADMTEQNAIDEGVSFIPTTDDWYSGSGLNPVSYLAGFRKLWNEINAGRGYVWDPDLWVWAIRYHVHEILVRAA